MKSLRKRIEHLRLSVSITALFWGNTKVGYLI